MVDSVKIEVETSVALDEASERRAFQAMWALTAALRYVGEMGFGVSLYDDGDHQSIRLEKDTANG